MAEAGNQREVDSAELAEVVDLFSHGPSPTRLTAGEIAEYRRLRSQLRQMLEEWSFIKSHSGCPVAHRLTTSDD